MNPITLHPKNPHYFLFRGKPTVLISSAEHYGAVLNLDFKFIPYLEELHAHGLNLTRAFTGAYLEEPATFNIENNTLGPLPGRFICPWARSDTPGYAGGGCKFDLERWDDAYFRRLKEYCQEAGRRGVIVEVVLFCPFYRERLWEISPMNAANNVNGLGHAAFEEIYTQQHADLQRLQEAMVRKIVGDLRDLDNIYYEICNEPYQGGVTPEWQRRIAAVIQEAEASFPAKHLIAQNIANGAQEVKEPDPAVSLLNFHYANPPDSVTLNYALNRVIGFDETGFKGTADLPYRTDGWEFMMAGGGVYDHLDFSFTCQHPDGTAPITRSPGGGGPTVRRQLAILKRFIESFDFVRMKPDNTVIRGGVTEGVTAWALVEPGQAYALYLKGGTHANLTLDVPAGRYHAEWLNPRTGAADKEQDVDHPGGPLTVSSPPYEEDVALRLRSRR
jgi:hypothetical protein